MEKYRVKCIGCNKKYKLICSNCSRKQFNTFDNYLECSHCQKELTTSHHECVSRSYNESNDMSASTGYIQHRKNFISCGSSRGGSSLGGRFFLYMVIFAVVYFLIFPSLFLQMFS